MTGKAHKGEAGSTVGGSEDTLPLLSLPAAVLTHVAEFGLRRYSATARADSCGHPLLGVSQACRDAVLHATRTLSLTYNHTPTPVPAAQQSADARLLHRACCEASPGLDIDLTLPFRKEPGMLTVLLQPGINSGGWHKVHKLQVGYAQESIAQIPLAFPCLYELRLGGGPTQLGDGAIFHTLAGQPSCLLQSLTLINCIIKTDAVGHAAHSLARLPHLQALWLEGPGVPASIAAQLTGLTSLNLGSGADAEQMFQVVGENTGLAQLEFGRSEYDAPYTAKQQQLTLLSACTNLTQLNISGVLVDGQALDLLLTQCTSIISLTLGRTTIDSSRADKQCSWRMLHLRGPWEAKLLQLAYLPLRSVQELSDHWGNDNILSGRLELPPVRVPAAQLPSLLRQAATNLATCPAWIRAAPSQLSLEGGQELSADQRVQLFQALGPLAAPHVKGLTIQLMEQLKLGSAEVQAIANSIGGGLQALTLRRCTLLGTFWEALAHHFPQLSSITLSNNVRAGVNDIAKYLAVCPCSSPQATGMHLKFHISPWVLGKRSQLQLQEHISRLQLQNITLLFE